MRNSDINSINFRLVFTIVVGFSIAAFLFIISRLIKIESIFEPGIILIVFYIKQVLIERKRLNFNLSFLLFGIISFIFLHILFIAARSFISIPEWDFPCFYLFGKVGVSGGNFYDPAVFRKLYEELNLVTITSNSFTDQIVNVGFWYPPTSMFVFYPLGLFDLSSAYILWQSAVIGFLIADIFLIIKIFEGKLMLILNDADKLITVIIVLLFPLFQSSIWFSQTNGAILFLFLLIISKIGHWRNGILLCIMVILKPLFILLGIYFLFKRNWKIVWVALVTGSAILLLTGVVFGFDVYYNYFTSPPTLRMPSLVYLESLNQSLHSFLWRFQNSIPFLNWPFYKVLTFIISSALLVYTVVLSIKLMKSKELLAFLIYIPTMLLVYPGTLSHYAVFLIPLVIKLYKDLKMIHGEIVLPIVAFAFIVGSASLFLLNFLLIAGVSYYLFKDKNLFIS